MTEVKQSALTFQDTTPIVMFIMYIPIFIISKCKKKDSNKTETKEKQEITV